MVARIKEYGKMWRWLWQKVRDDYDWVFIISDEVFLLLNLTFDNSWFFLSVFSAYEMLACGVRDGDKTEEFMLILILICFLSLPLSLSLSFWFAWLVGCLGSAALLHSSIWPPESWPEERGVEYLGLVPCFCPSLFVSCFQNKHPLL